MMQSRRLVPRAGNAMRPVFLFLAGAFAVMLIAFPIGMYLLGLGMAGIAAVTLLILAVTVGILAFVLYLARAYDVDEARLEEGEMWAEWTLSDRERDRFVADQRRSTRRTALAYAIGGSALGILLGVLQDDRLLAGIMIGVFLLAAAVILTMAGPPRTAGDEAARRVMIGPSGVHLLGRYLPFAGTMTRLQSVRLAPGDPATLRFSVRSGRRVQEIAVPVPPDRLELAQALADRFNSDGHR